MGSERPLTAAEYEESTGNDWPLTVSEVLLYCRADYSSVYAQVGEDDYLVTGAKRFARTRDIEEITKPGADVILLSAMGTDLC